MLLEIVEHMQAICFGMY